MKVLRVLTRVYLDSADLEKSIAFYETLFHEKCSLRFPYPQVGLELAQVGSVLLVAGSEKALAPFRATQATFLVDSLSEATELLASNGAIILEDPKQVPTGMNMRAQHPDGMVVEYVEHRKQQR